MATGQRDTTPQTDIMRPPVATRPRRHQWLAGRAWRDIVPARKGHQVPWQRGGLTGEEGGRDAWGQGAGPRSARP